MLLQVLRSRFNLASRNRGKITPSMGVRMSCVYDTSCAAPVQAYFDSIPEKIKALSLECWRQKINLVGRTSSFLNTLQKLEQFAQSGRPVLITGESGVGKELFARSLYLLSAQNGRPFIPINCSQFSNEHLLVRVADLIISRFRNFGIFLDIFPKKLTI